MGCSLAETDRNRACAESNSGLARNGNGVVGEEFPDVKNLGFWQCVFSTERLRSVNGTLNQSEVDDAIWPSPVRVIRHHRIDKLSWVNGGHELAVPKRECCRRFWVIDLAYAASPQNLARSRTGALSAVHILIVKIWGK